MDDACTHPKYKLKSLIEQIDECLAWADQCPTLTHFIHQGEIVITFKDFLKEDGIDYFLVEVPTSLLQDLNPVHEGRWIESGKKGYMLRVDAEDPSIKQQRHVHIAKSKHINTKTMQASWNKDGTKHDTKTFNSNVGALNVVQSIARDALGLPASVKLEEALNARQLIERLESIQNNGITPKLFRVIDA